MAIMLRTKDLERRKERLGKYIKFMVLFVAWLISIINQAFGGIITNLVPLVVIPDPFVRGFLIVVILIILGLVAGLLWIIDATRIIAEVPKRSHTILDYPKEESEKRSPIARILRWLRRRHTNTVDQ